MSDDLIAPAPVPVLLAVDGGQRFAVRRIYGVGRNYSAHVREMGGDPKADPPVFFAKPTDAATQAPDVPYPTATEDLHFEGELVVALGEGGRVVGYAAGCDLTRRDLQAAAKAAGGPWDMAKGFDQSAPMGLIATTAPTADARLRTIVNGETRQEAPLSDMTLPVGEILAALSGYVALRPGDLVFTGTPAGVGPLQRGDVVRVEIEGLAPLEFRIT